MTCNDLLKSATALVCERLDDGLAEDYTERAPYILAAFCSQCKGVDASYRRAYQLPAITYSGKATLPLGETFPLVDELIPAATYFLAAMLILDENEKLSDKLMDLYTDSVATLAASLPFISERIAQKYK